MIKEHELAMKTKGTSSPVTKSPEKKVEQKKERRQTISFMPPQTPEKTQRKQSPNPIKTVEEYEAEK